MDNLSLFLVGLISGLLLHVLLNFFIFRKGRGEELPATKEDARKIIDEIERIKFISKNNYDLKGAEQEFYDENGIE